MRLIGVDFTSAPRRAKPITVANGVLDDSGLALQGLETCASWCEFEALLTRPGPWLGGFDFPFGLPREAVLDLGWPADWPALVQHCAALGRERFRAVLDAYRQTRPSGARYAHRATDRPARSHSPLKLVNPPVGLMFLEGAPRLLAAGLCLPGLHAGPDVDSMRVAVEAYPGLLARAITPASYKSDDRRKHTAGRRAARADIVTALETGNHPLGISLRIDSGQRIALYDDAGGDQLDAVLALVQAAWCVGFGPPRYGMPEGSDPLEGWIATAGG